jgi:hypothetical protein
VRLAHGLAHALFFLYALWASALQAALAAPPRLGEWTPDLGLLLLFAWAGKLGGGRAVLAAASVALARATFGADPFPVLAAATLGALGLAAGLRAGLEVDRAVPRAALCGLCALLTAELLVAARGLALAAETSGARLEGVRLWPGALATALACLVLAPLCLRLPGLASLERRRR